MLIDWKIGHCLFGIEGGAGGLKLLFRRFSDITVTVAAS